MEKKMQITSDRLLLHIPEPEDLAEIVEFMVENATFLAPFEPIRSKDYYTQDYWQNKIEQHRYNFNQSLSLYMLIRIQDSGRMAGFINYSHFERASFQNCRVGYALGEKFEGKGIMLEAMRASIEFIFGHLKLHRIEANVMPENIRSRNLLKRLHFIEHGLAPEYLKIAGEWRDHIQTSLINPEWELLD